MGENEGKESVFLFSNLTTMGTFSSFFSRKQGEPAKQPFVSRNGPPPSFGGCIQSSLFLFSKEEKNSLKAFKDILPLSFLLEKKWGSGGTFNPPLFWTNEKDTFAKCHKNFRWPAKNILFHSFIFFIFISKLFSIFWETHVWTQGGALSGNYVYNPNEPNFGRSIWEGNRFGEVCTALYVYVYTVRQSHFHRFGSTARKFMQTKAGIN